MAFLLVRTTLILVGLIMLFGQLGGCGDTGDEASNTSSPNPAVASTVPLPPWLSYCDTSACDPTPVIATICPKTNPLCTPLRSSYVVTAVNGRAISGTFFPLAGPVDANLHLVSGNGQAIANYLWVYSALHLQLASESDLQISYYNIPLNWGGTTALNFEGIQLKSSLVDTVFYRHPSYDTGTAASQFHTQAQAIIMSERAITDLTTEHATAFVMPTELAVVSGGEGNFSYGNGTVTINYGNPPYIAALGGIANTALPRFAHEYAHELFNEIHSSVLSGNIFCFNEGAAEALAFLTGFLPETEFGPIGLRGDDFDAGCLPLSESHDVGNCYFWHIKNSGLLTPSFMHGIFHPQHAFTFNSCTQTDIRTGNSVLVYFTEAAGGANMIPVLDSMKIPHADSYTAAKLALGL